MWSEDGGGHDGVSILQQGHSGGQRPREGRREGFPQGLWLVQQDVLDEEGRCPVGRHVGTGRRVVPTHPCQEAPAPGHSASVTPQLHPKDRKNAGQVLEKGCPPSGTLLFIQAEGKPPGSAFSQ